MGRRVGRGVRLVAALAALLAVAGCREEERERILMQEKGVYQGAPDTELRAEQIEQLRDRTRGQRF